MSGVAALAWDAWLAKRGGGEAIVRRQRARLGKMVAHARASTAFYRDLYRNVPDRVESPEGLPVADKTMLMTRFDEAVADPAVTRAGADSFVQDAGRIGEKFLGKYTLLTTSGTTGNRGLFVLDDHVMDVTRAIAVRMLTSWLAPQDFMRMALGGARLSMVMATGGHFASAVAAARLAKGGRAKSVQILSVHMAMEELVGALNRHRPLMLAPYASVAALLADEQHAGRLNIHPLLIALSAEGLPASEYQRIAQTFACKVGNSYAATECTFLSYSCGEGWLHLNADWAILEPVDAEHRPVRPGEQSHTVLLSNLANRVQPILRYDLGDSVLMRPDRCACGNPLPAIKVQGRSAETLGLQTASGQRVALAPLIFATIVDRTPGVAQFQMVQTAPTRLRVRLRAIDGESADFVWRAVRGQIVNALRQHGLENVELERGEEPPEQSKGGKYRTIIPLAPPGGT